MKRISILIGACIVLVVSVFIFYFQLISHYLDHLVFTVFNGSVDSLFISANGKQISQAYDQLSNQGYDKVSKQYLINREFCSWAFFGLIFVIILVFIVLILMEYRDNKKRKERFQDLYDVLSGKTNELNMNCEERLLINLFNKRYREVEHRNQLFFYDHLRQMEEQENLAHQIKGSLSSILLSADLIEQDFQQTDMQLISIVEEVERSSRLLNEFLNSQVITKNQTNYKYSPCMLMNCLNECVENIKSIVDQRSQKIILEGDDSYILLDRIHFKEAIHCILANAAEYGKIQSNIQIQVVKHSEGLILTIQSESEIESAISFERYKTTNQSKGHFGIGLHMAAKVIQNHFGTISIETKEPYIKFIIQLPVFREEIAKL